MSKGLKIYFCVIAILSVIAIIVVCALDSGSPTPSKTSNSTPSSTSVNGKEVRCWYCGKVIVNSDGKIIHAKHQQLNTYKCEYCNTDNVIEQ